MTRDIPGLIHEWPVVPLAQYRQALVELADALDRAAAAEAEVARLRAELARAPLDRERWADVLERVTKKPGEALPGA